MYLKISGFVTLVGHFFKKTTRHFVIGTRHIYDTEHIENNVLPLYSLLFSYRFVHNMPVSLKSSLTAHNLKTGGVSLLFFLLDNFSQLHTNLTPPLLWRRTVGAFDLWTRQPTHVGENTRYRFLTGLSEKVLTRKSLNESSSPIQLKSNSRYV